MAADTSWKTRQMSALRSRIEISNDRRPHFMVLRALPEAGCLMRLFATALQSYAQPPSRKRRLSLTQHFQQCDCILRRGAFGVVVEINVHVAVFL